MKLGSIGAARDPDNPTARKLAATEAAVRPYQRVVDTH
jgi:hypothetical protein